MDESTEPQMSAPDIVSGATSQQEKDARIAAARRAYEGSRKDKSLDEILSLWEALWEACDFSWEGLADAGWDRGDGANYAQKLKRWRAPASVPCDGSVHGDGDAAWKEATLQDYWRCTPLEEGGWRDDLDGLRTKGLLIERDGRLWHALHVLEAHTSVANEDTNAPVDLRGDQPTDNTALTAAPTAALTVAIGVRLAWAQRQPETEQVDSGPDWRALLCGARAAALAKSLQAFTTSNLEGEAREHIRLKARLAKFHDADFSGATFTGDADFSNATFTGKAGFHATFTGDASFSGATFTGDARFFRATFTGEADFRRATFTGEAHFSGATFTSEADFFQATFAGEVDFYRATFTGEAHFYGATFTSEADFAGATFTGEADFPGATFTGVVTHFSGATFIGDADFSDARFTGEAGFFRATFTGEADFNHATFKKIANWPAAEFLGYAHFAGVTWGEKVHYGGVFAGARFRNVADFQTTNFSAFAAFDRARFESFLLLSDPTGGKKPEDMFRAACEVADAAIRKSVYLEADKESEDGIPENIQREAAEGRWSELSGGYRTAKKAMEVQGDFSREQHYYRFEVKARLERPSTRLTEKLVARFYGVFSRFGASIGRPIAGIGIFILLFAAIYLCLAMIQCPSAEGWQALEFSLNNAFRPFHALSIQEPSQSGAESLAEILLFKLGGGWGNLVRLLTIVQSFLTIVLVFLLGLAVRRKFQIS